MFKLNDKVKIKSSNIEGIVVDVSNINSNVNYVVESDKKGVSTGYGGDWKLFDCTEDELEIVN